MLFPPAEIWFIFKASLLKGLDYRQTSFLNFCSWIYFIHEFFYFFCYLKIEKHFLDFPVIFYHLRYLLLQSYFNCSCLIWKIVNKGKIYSSGISLEKNESEFWIRNVYACLFDYDRASLNYDNMLNYNINSR